MERLPLLHPVDANGQSIDASFSVELVDAEFALHYASRGGTIGTPNARNSQYHIGLSVLLARLKELDATITDLLLDSAFAKEHAIEERRLKLPANVRLPIRLSAIEDVDSFRKMLSEAQRNVLVAPGRHAKHGNRVRSIRILFSVANGDESVPLELVVSRLVGDKAVLPTDDPGELRDRARRLRSRGVLSRPPGNSSPTATASSSGKRYLRLPSVAAYVLQRAAGRCELCDASGFITDCGDVYLEIHHVVQLAHGGPDTTQNAVAVCANCHRELHFGRDRRALVATLASRVRELEIAHASASDITTYRGAGHGP